MSPAAEPLWVPTSDDVERAHATRLARDVGLASYAELWRWSVAHRADFWDAVARRLGFRFRTPGSAVLDDAAGPTQARWWPGATLNAIDACFRHPRERVALRFRRGGRLHAWSYGELHDAVRSAAGRFEPGEVVGFVTPMTPEAVVAYLAVAWVGGTVVSVAESFAAAEIGRRLQIGRVHRVLTQDVIERGGRTIPLRDRVAEAGVERTIVVRTVAGAGGAERPGDVAWPPPPLAGGGPPRAVATEAALNLLFSSGTTGDPKAIPWTHLTPLKAAMDAHLHMDVGADDVLCWPTSLGWMMGPWLLFAALVNGATVALFDGAPTEGAFGRFVRDAGVTLLGVVPSLVRRWRSSGCMDGIDWSRVRRFASTGEASDPDDMRWLSRRAGGRPVIEYCGGTEIGGGYVTGTLVEPSYPARFTTPALGIDLTLLDPAGRPADVGEVFLHPPSVGLSERLLNGDHDAVYHADTPRPGLRRHGDVMAREGTLYRALGRADDTMNLGGIKVSSAELEGVMRRVAGVRDVAAVGVPAAGGGGERLVAVVVPDGEAPDGEEAWRAALQGAISAELNPLFRVHEVVTRDALPRTASNKVMRRTLRTELGGEAS